MISADDLATAGVAILRAKALAIKVKGKVDASLIGAGPTLEEANDMANAAETLAYHAIWMRNELLKRNT